MQLALARAARYVSAFMSRSAFILAFFAVALATAAPALAVALDVPAQTAQPPVASPGQRGLRKVKGVCVTKATNYKHIRFCRYA